MDDLFLKTYPDHLQIILFGLQLLFPVFLAPQWLDGPLTATLAPDQPSESNRAVPEA